MFLIRSFKYPDDYNFVIKLWENSGEGIGIGFSDQPEEIAKKSHHDPDLFIVAEAGGLIVGTVIGGFDGRRGMIYHLAVADGFQKRGLGSQLMEEIESRLRSRGCRKAYLLVKNGNDAAAHFYQKRSWFHMDFVRIFGKNL